MLVTMKEMLADAQKRHYALPAFDVSNYEMMRAVLDTCEEEHSPALLMGLGVDLEGKGMNLIASMIAEASKFYSVPICLHLDHATDLALIKQAAAAGFSSVMYDGSVLPFEQNARNTAEVVRFAHGAGLTVEAELGHVGNAMVGNETDTKINEDPEDTLTDPADVVRFIDQTDVDALAIAIGTAHGVYKKTPTLRIDRLDEITAVCGRPLVLHGGSGTPDDQIKTAIEHGITKINIYSDVVAAMNNGLKSKLANIGNPATWPVFVFEEARANMKEVIRCKLRTFGSSNKA
ncbi:MAG: class II fructose-bisphosphate aldolase [Oscillospiraceae bacterium]|nr:class II fructose-bisphosphate aldolase [Oscillospiraceae bacterium]